MTEHEKLLLEIYEDITTSDFDKQILIESVESLKERPNVKYIDAFLKASNGYKKDLKEVKELIKSESYQKANVKLTVVKKDIEVLKKSIEDLPSDMPSTLISKCITDFSSCLLMYPIFKIMEPKLKKNMTKNIETIVSTSNDPKKVAMWEKIGNMDMSISFSDLFVDEIFTTAAIMAVKGVAGKKPIENGNTFKNKALKQIKKEMKHIKKLESQIKYVCKIS